MLVVILLVIGIVSLAGWQIFILYRQSLIRFELDKLNVWRQRVEVASKLLDTDLRALSIQAQAKAGPGTGMTFTDVFVGIFKAFDQYGRRMHG